MAATTANPILTQIRRMVEDERTKLRSDHELLAQFVSQRDETAFNALVRRHGSMVLEVCRSGLPNESDVEDAFQATFLILARKAGSIRKSGSLASWLHGVAHRTTLQAREAFARRSKHEPRVAKSEAKADDNLSWREVQHVLHEELNELAERYRGPLVICYLQGKTQDEAAAILAMAKGTLKKRLEQGRALLRTRLARRGLGPAAVLLASAWPAAGSAALAKHFTITTTRAAMLAASGNALTGLVSAKAILLSERGVALMLLSKTKLTPAALCCAILLGIGVGGLCFQTAGAEQAEIAVEATQRASLPVGLVRQVDITNPNELFEVAAQDRVTRNEQTGPGNRDQASGKPASVVLPAKLFGRVVSQGKPVPGASVTVHLNDPGAEGVSYAPAVRRVRTWQSVSDANGKYEISTGGGEVPRWCSLIYFAQSENLPQSIEGRMSVTRANTKESLGDLAHPEGVVVTGRVMNSTGKPAAGAVVRKAASFGPEAWFPEPSQTDAEGRFRFAVPRNQYVELLVLSKDDAPTRVNVQPGTSDLGDIRMKSGTKVRGTLVDEMRKPLGGAVIAVEGADHGQMPQMAFSWSLATKTAKDGSFTFPPLLGRCKLWVTSAYWSHLDPKAPALRMESPAPLVIPQLLTIDGAQGEMNIKLQAKPPATIRGQIRWPDGRPGSGQEIIAYASIDKVGTAIYFGSVKTDAQGKYELRLPRGIENVMLNAIGLRDAKGKVHISRPKAKGPMTRGYAGIMEFATVPRDLEGADWELVHQPQPGERTQADKWPGQAELEKLAKRHDEKLQALQNALATTPKEQQAALFQQNHPANDGGFVAALEDFEKRHRGERIGLAALHFLVRLGISSAPGWAADKGRTQALSTMLAHYAKHEDLDVSLQWLNFGPANDGSEVFLSKLAEVSPHVHVKAAVLFSGASLLKERARGIERGQQLLAELRQDAEKNKEQIERIEQVLAGLRQTDGAELRRKAKLLAQRVVDEFANVPLPTFHTEGHGAVIWRRDSGAESRGTYGEKAQALLFEIANLVVGQNAPEIEGKDAEGKVLRLSDFRGKVVVLMFSANWCGPCKQLYPTLRKFQNSNTDKPFTVLTVMADFEAKTVRDAIAKKEITWPAWWDGEGGPIAARWNVQHFPTIYLIDEKGILRGADVPGNAVAKMVSELVKSTR